VSLGGVGSSLPSSIDSTFDLDLFRKTRKYKRAVVSAARDRMAKVDPTPATTAGSDLDFSADNTIRV